MAPACQRRTSRPAWLVLDAHAPRTHLHVGDDGVHAAARGPVRLAWPEQRPPKGVLDIVSYQGHPYSRRSELPCIHFQPRGTRFGCPRSGCRRHASPCHDARHLLIPEDGGCTVRSQHSGRLSAHELYLRVCGQCEARGPCREIVDRPHGLIAERQSSTRFLATK